MSVSGERARDDKGRYARGDGKESKASTAAPLKKRPRERASAKGPIGWTKPKEAVFFRELAMVCNVSAALRTARLTGSSSLAYERRKTDGRFRAAWAEAIEQSYAMLELEMLERARLGDDRPPPATEAEKRLRAIPTSLALQLLKLYESRVKARAAGPPGRTPGSAASGSGAFKAEPRLTRERRSELRREFDAMLTDFNRRMGGQG